MYSKAQLEALELLVKAGMVQPGIPWEQVIPQATQHILGLAGRLMKEISDIRDTGSDQSKEDA